MGVDELVPPLKCALALLKGDARGFEPPVQRTGVSQEN